MIALGDQEELTEWFPYGVEVHKYFKNKYTE